LSSWNNLIAEGLVEAEKSSFLKLAVLSDQLLSQIIPQQPAASGKCERQLLRTSDALRRGREEAVEESRDRRDAVVA